MTDSVPPIDLTFLRAQTFGDAALEREVLRLFLEQARRLIPHLADLPPAEQAATAHLLKGSCLGIGAVPLSVLLEHYGQADPGARRDRASELCDGFRVLATAIEARLDVL